MLDELAIYSRPIDAVRIFNYTTDTELLFIFNSLILADEPDENYSIECRYIIRTTRYNVPGGDNTELITDKDTIGELVSKHLERIRITLLMRK